MSVRSRSGPSPPPAESATPACVNHSAGPLRPSVASSSFQSPPMMTGVLAPRMLVAAGLSWILLCGSGVLPPLPL